MRCGQNVEESIPVTAPGKILVPSTVEEVVAAVKAAAALPAANIRCIAHGASWTNVFFDKVRTSRASMRMLHTATFLPQNTPGLIRNAACCMQGATVLFMSELLLPSGNRIELAGCAYAPL